MNKLIKNMALGAIFAGGLVVGYQKLLTPKARTMLTSTSKEVATLLKNLMKENNLKQRKEANLTLISVLDKTENEWNRIGF